MGFLGNIRVIADFYWIRLGCGDLASLYVGLATDYQCFIVVSDLYVALLEAVVYKMGRFLAAWSTLGRTVFK